MSTFSGSKNAKYTSSMHYNSTLCYSEPPFKDVQVKTLILKTGEVGTDHLMRNISETISWLDETMRPTKTRMLREEPSWGWFITSLVRACTKLCHIHRAKASISPQVSVGRWEDVLYFWISFPWPQPRQLDQLGCHQASMDLGPDDRSIHAPHLSHTIERACHPGLHRPGPMLWHRARFGCAWYSMNPATGPILQGPFLCQLPTWWDPSLSGQQLSWDHTGFRQASLWAGVRWSLRILCGLEWNDCVLEEV